MNPFASFKHRNYILYSIAILLMFLGSWMSSAAMGWLVYEMTNSVSLLGVVAFCGQIAALIFTLPAGVVADRYPKRKVVTMTQFSAMVVAFILAFSVKYDFVTVPIILTISTLHGIIGAIDTPVRHSMVVEIVGRKDLPNAVALNSSIFNGARMIGPVIAGWVMAAWGAVFCFFANAFGYLCAFIMMVCLDGSQMPDVQPVKEDTKALFKEGFRYVWSEKTIFRIMVASSISFMFVGGSRTIMPAYAKDVVHVGAAGYGWLMASIGVGACIAAIIIAGCVNLFDRVKVIMLGSLMTPISAIVLYFVPHYYASLVCLFFVGFGMMLYHAVSNSYIQETAPDDIVGRVVGIRTFCMAGPAPLAMLLIGKYAAVRGCSETFLMCGIATLIASIFMVILPEAHRLRNN